MDAKEKLTGLREQLVPVAMEQVGQLGGPMALVGAFLGPQLEGWVDRFLEERTADDCDEWLEQAIDFLGRVRSDGRAAILVDGDTRRVKRVTGHEDREHFTVWLGDPVRGPDLRDGADGLGEEHPGETVAALVGGAAPGDRPD